LIDCTKEMRILIVLFTVLFTFSTAFHIPTSHVRHGTILHATKSESSHLTTLEVVLFGTGDLRTVDHGGLAAALSPGSLVLPLVLLDTQDTLPNIPMAVTHTMDTATMLSTSIHSLKDSLANIGLQLHVKSSDADGSKSGIKDLLDSVLIEVKDTYPGISKVIIHTCDLEFVDNQLGYGPYGHLDDYSSSTSLNVKIQAWNCHLRDASWSDVHDKTSAFPDKFIEYESKYINDKVNSCYEILDNSQEKKNQWTCLNVPSLQVPSSEHVKKLLFKALDYDVTDENVMKLLEQEKNSGLFATHWGGLDIEKTFNTASMMKAIDIFLGLGTMMGQDGDDALANNLNWWQDGLTRNPLSLEHAALTRMMKSGNQIKTENLIEGELLTRSLAAPLLYGLISPRYILNQTNLAKSKISSSFIDGLIPSILKGRDTLNVVSTLVESREWHKLFATKNLLSPENNGLFTSFWRWHGFLCRYEGKEASETSPDLEKEGIIFVHGFGASGSQWRKAVNALSEVDGCQRLDMLSPDLIGFGQSEKPNISYTQYLWESYTSTFVKDIAIKRKGWKSYTIGGNSIGGYTAMGAAADDKAMMLDVSNVSASGAPGAQKCKGLVLMNSAGRVLKKDDIVSNGSRNGLSVAEATANDLLGELSIPSRIISSIGGTGLLWYLRPRIQSICVNLYPTNPAAVDDELCNGILRDSLDPGALNVMISGSKLPPPRTANELLGADFGSAKNRGYEMSVQTKTTESNFDGPVLVAQGILDPLNDAKDRANCFESLRSGITVDRINAGHCPHDELPKEIAASIGSWMKVSSL